MPDRAGGHGSNPPAVSLPPRGRNVPLYVSLACVGTAFAFCAPAAGGTSQVPGWFPPRVAVKHDARSVAARPSGYCYKERHDDGTVRSICADAQLPALGRSLAVQPGKRVVVRVNRPAQSLDAKLGYENSALPVRRLAGSRKRWVIRLPRTLRQRARLDLFLKFDFGNANYHARLRQRQTSST